MKYFENSILLCLILFVVTSTSYAQALVPVKSSFRIDESMVIFNKVAGERISHDAFSAIIRKNPRVNFQTEMNERGEVTTIIYDPRESAFTEPDLSLRPKPNQPFPEFIFTTTSGETIRSEELGGKVVVLYFNMAFKEPFATPEVFKDFENAINSSSTKNEVVPIIITHSAAEEISGFTEKVKVPYPIVANGTNFFQKYTIMKVPSYVVIKSDGTLAAYADNLIELKQVLSETE